MGGEETVGLVDNDVVSKLAICGLLDHLASTLGLDGVRVLGAMRLQLLKKSSGRMRHKLDEQGKESVQAWIDGVVEVQELDEDLIARCSLAEIDNGEAILLDHARRTPTPF